MPTTIAAATECPMCGKTGKTVKPATLRALLREEHATVVAVPEPSACESGCTPGRGSTGWRFCDAPDCDVVYFGEQNGITFTKDQLKVWVGVKETTDERPLCYCFGHSVATIKEELRTKGRSDALDDIRAKMEDPGCHCEVSNPSGACCLGSVARGIETAKAELNHTTYTPPSSHKAETITKIGTVLTAIMASSCCWLPLLLLAFGVSGAGIAATLESFRPLFIVATCGFLGTAFYLTYRPRPSANTGGDCCSAVPDCCAAPVEGMQRRFSLRNMNKVMLWVVTLLAVLFLFFPKYVGFVLTRRDGTNNLSVAGPLVLRTTIAIEGMTCETCAVTLQKAIKDVPGVLGAQVDFPSKHAIVSTEACCQFPKDEILKVIEDVGFAGVITESK